ncbi:addiction module antidote protein, HigA family [Flavobacterium oncorhynchi]|uniref:Addiction module antidote protein, HigA family n=1 Tax=Flavobacterium oncorhynchi TaxID=728056 RepID=A0A226HVP1_9FLAO|nr:HigA family addiction module antitoxin [Flavobacterium oncorhynchi]OXA98204.1 addiction module antidote protein, HigA family [Flavobacterium oncorhynchi]
MERKMRNVHPGEILKMELIEGRKLSMRKIAKLLDTSLLSISNILNGREEITPTIALGLENVLGGKADFFLRLQATYDLEEVKKRN